MTQTVVAVFNSYSAAQQAARHLSSQGIAEEAVHVTEAEDSIEPDPLAYDDPSRHGIRGFFAELFSTNDYSDDLARYRSAMRRGAALVTVNLDTEDGIDEVERVLTEAGAINIDEEWSLDGGDADAPTPLWDSSLASTTGLADTGGASVGGRASVPQATPEPASGSARLGSAEQDLVERNASPRELPQSGVAQDQSATQPAETDGRSGVRVYPRRSDV